MEEIEKIARNKEYQRFKQAIGTENDPTMLVLRAHLFSENILERIITQYLPRGDRAVENGNLTFNQKLVIVDAIDCLPDSIMSSLRNLNKLRNKCAHELDKSISNADITKIGSPIGKEFTRIKRESEFDDIRILKSLIEYICGFITGHCHKAEHTQ